MKPDLWASYFYPETYDPETQTGTLRNLFDERDPVLLRDQEYMNSAERERQLTSGEVDVDRTYDAEHLRAIHKHLFQDSYEWAGEYRTVWMQKIISFAEVQEIPRYLEDAGRLIHEADWSRMDRDQFVDQAATVFAYVNTGGSALSE